MLDWLYFLNSKVYYLFSNSKVYYEGNNNGTSYLVHVVFTSFRLFLPTLLFPDYANFFPSLKFLFLRKNYFISIILNAIKCTNLRYTYLYGSFILNYFSSRFPLNSPISGKCIALPDTQMLSFKVFLKEEWQKIPYTNRSVTNQGLYSVIISKLRAR